MWLWWIHMILTRINLSERERSHPLPPWQDTRPACQSGRRLRSRPQSVSVSAQTLDNTRMHTTHLHSKAHQIHKELASQSMIVWNFTTNFPISSQLLKLQLREAPHSMRNGRFYMCVKWLCWRMPFRDARNPHVNRAMRFHRLWVRGFRSLGSLLTECE
jgi:hypothetical protein